MLAEWAMAEIGIIVALFLQTSAFLFWGGRTYQLLHQLQKQVTDHESRLRGLEKQPKARPFQATPVGD